jgi:hypothetical protein
MKEKPVDLGDHQSHICFGVSFVVLRLMHLPSCYPLFEAAVKNKKISSML